MVGNVPSDPSAVAFISEIARQNDEVHGISKSLDIISFEFEPIRSAIVRDIYRIDPFQNYALLSSFNAIAELMFYLLY